MPVYEYWCHNCLRKVDLYFPSLPQSPPRCSQCDNALSRLFSTFSLRKTDKAIYEDILSDSRLIKGMLRNNPKALAEWNRRMSRGEKPAPEYEEMVTRMERGEMPTPTTPVAHKKEEAE